MTVEVAAAPEDGSNKSAGQQPRGLPGGQPASNATEEALLWAQTAVGLDWDQLWDTVAESARTELGKRRIKTAAPYSTLEQVDASLDCVEEVVCMLRAKQELPLAGIDDVADTLRRAAKGAVLCVEELCHVTIALRGLLRLQSHMESNGFAARFPHLHSVWHSTALWMDTAAVEGEVVSSIGDHRGLCEDRYPQLCPLKARREDARRLLEELSSAGGEASRRNAVTRAEEALASATAALEAAERQILVTVTEAFKPHCEACLASLHAAASLDDAWARGVISHRLNASRPTVGVEGTIRVQDARHPLLHLTGCDPVPNDLELTDSAPALIVSGPNGGGKTVAMKTFGLLALLVAHGCGVPAARGARVDLFQVVAASLGDYQDVTAGLSTFSGHLQGISAIVRTIKTRRGSGLVLLDELCSGTDPAQGAALAQAIMESLLDLGVRLVVTTHYSSVKSLAVFDNRFSVAAMQSSPSGRPSFRLIQGQIGLSRPLLAGKRAGLAASVLSRARELLGDEATLIDGMHRTDNAAVRLDDVQRTVSALTEELQAAEKRLDRLQRNAERQRQEMLRRKTEMVKRKLRVAYEELDTAYQAAIKAEEAWYGIDDSWADDAQELDRYYGGAEDPDVQGGAGKGTSGGGGRGRK